MIDAIRQQIANYQTKHRLETISGVLLNQLEDSDSWEVLNRHNMVGHITTSIFILNSALTHVLLVKHKALGLWIQPGGHWEYDVSLAISARREGLQETGVIAELIDESVPLDIDTHFIPANPAKNEAEHFHHDFCYLARAPKDAHLQIQIEEVDDAEWVSLNHLVAHDMSRTGRCARKSLAWIVEQTLSN